RNSPVVLRVGSQVRAQLHSPTRTLDRDRHDVSSQVRRFAGWPVPAWTCEPRRDGRRGHGAATTALGSCALTNVFHSVRRTEFASAATSDPTPVSNSVTATTSAAANASSNALPRRRTTNQCEFSSSASAILLSVVALSEFVL